MKKINLISGFLVIYLIVMGVLYWPGNNPQEGYGKYLLVLGGTLLIIIVLRIIQIKRLKMRDKWRKENEERR